MAGSFPFDRHLNGLRYFDPHGAGSQDTCHLGVSDTGRKSAHTTVGGCMAVGSEYNVAGLYIPGFSHQLMADSVASMNILHAILLGEGIAPLKVTRIVNLAGRYEVIVDQNNFVRIPQLRKAHLFELFRYERNKDVMDHDTVHIYGYNVAGRTAWPTLRLTIFSIIVCPIC